MGRNGIADELRELLDTEDPRTLKEIKSGDQWQEGTLTEVTAHDDGGWSLSWTEERERRADEDVLATLGGTFGAGISADRNPDAIIPEVGQTIRFYGRGFGSTFHGIDIDGREVFWRTPLERVSDRVEWLAKNDRDKRERYVRDRARNAASYAALSEPLRARIDRFRFEKPSFGIDSESYEMFACVEADKIAAALEPLVDAEHDATARVQWFMDLPYEEQKALAGLDDGHSGNTFGGACSLARAILAGDPV